MVIVRVRSDPIDPSVVGTMTPPTLQAELTVSSMFTW